MTPPPPPPHHLQCSACAQTFDRAEKLQLHFARHHVEPAAWTHECPNCGKIYPHPKILQRHIRDSHAAAGVECTQPGCAVVFKSENARRNHERRFHSAPCDDVSMTSPKKEYACDRCELTFTKRNLLKKHTFEHTGVLPYACPECSKAFATAQHLKRHQKVHRGYRCDRCDEVAATWTALRSHKKTAHAQSLACLECGKTFTRHDNLVSHRRTTHATTAADNDVVKVQRYTCGEEDCGRSYTRPSALRNHCRVAHKRGARHSCDVCEKTFAHAHTLRKHARVHAEPPPAADPSRARAIKRAPAARPIVKPTVEKVDAIVAEMTGIMMPMTLVYN